MAKRHAIRKLFANDIHRRIEEVIKVDQTNEESSATKSMSTS